MKDMKCNQLLDLFLIVQNTSGQIADMVQNTQDENIGTKVQQKVSNMIRQFDVILDDAQQRQMLLQKSVKPYLDVSENLQSQMVDAAQQYCEELLCQINEQLLAELKTLQLVSQKTAKRLIKHLPNCRKDTLFYQQFVLNAAVCCSEALPKESFEWIIDLFEQTPDLLKDSSVHLNYIYQPTAQRTFTQCPICKGTGEAYYTAFSYSMINFDNPFLPAKLWMKCKNCHNLYTYQYPEQLLEMGQHCEVVFSEHSPNHILEAMPIQLRSWCDILNALQKYTKGKNLLEVGTGTGELLAVALEMEYQIDAVEIVKEDAQKVSNILNIPIWCCDFLQFKTEKQYDVLIMGDVLEHMADPTKALRKAWELLRPDGVLWISTPNYQSSFSRMRKFNDPMWKEPYHIVYFSGAGLKDLTEQCGFVTQEYHVSNHYYGSMELILKKKGN